MKIIMKKLLIYIHGKGGNALEANHYKSLFNGYDVIGFDYKSNNPWEAKKEFSLFLKEQSNTYKHIEVLANSVGAYFLMNVDNIDSLIDKAYFISPIVNMEKLIMDMMKWANVNEETLKEKVEIPTSFNETLSYPYLIYVRENPLKWSVPTYIVYGENDHLTSLSTIKEFSNKTNSKLTIMKNGEHFFHTEEEMKFIDDWLWRILKRK